MILMKSGKSQCLGTLALLPGQDSLFYIQQSFGVDRRKLQSGPGRSDKEELQHSVKKGPCPRQLEKQMLITGRSLTVSTHMLKLLAL